MRLRMHLGEAEDDDPVLSLVPMPGDVEIVLASELMEAARAVERPEVGHVLHHAERARIAARIGADPARVAGIDIAAGGTFDQAFAHHVERLEQGHQRSLAPLDQPQHRAPGRAGAKPRQARQGRAQRLDLLRCHRCPDRARKAKTERNQAFKAKLGLSS